MQQYPQGQIVCPIDSAPDTIQKVTAIVNGAALGGHAGYAASKSLIRLLEHKTTVKRPRLTRPQTVAVAVLMLAILSCACSGVSGMSSASASANGGFTAFLLTCASITAFVLLSLLIQERQKVLELRQNIPRSNMEMEHNLWEQLYYCHRHDVVFLPGLDLTAPPHQMNVFLRQTREAMDIITEQQAFQQPMPDVLETRHMDGGYMV